eukprot:1176165-Prorocentrum_minimum.AAC.1
MYRSDWPKKTGHGMTGNPDGMTGNPDGMTGNPGQTAGFVTEFGGVTDTETGVAEVQFVLDLFDKMSPPTSWAFWDFALVRGAAE